MFSLSVESIFLFFSFLSFFLSFLFSFLFTFPLSLYFLSFFRSISSFFFFHHHFLFSSTLSSQLFLLFPRIFSLLLLSVILSSQVSRVLSEFTFPPSNSQSNKHNSTLSASSSAPPETFSQARSKHAKFSSVKSSVNSSVKSASSRAVVSPSAVSVCDVCERAVEAAADDLPWWSTAVCGMRDWKSNNRENDGNW